ncbi:MAG: maleylpyruvate isomerase N-terminal domain-containing protein [Nocardioidaceae bacterium]
MPSISHAYVVAADSVIELLSRPEVAAGWHEPSALPEWTVGGLGGHLAGQIFSVVDVVGAPPADQDPISVDEHYARAAWVSAGLDDEVNIGIRAGGDDNAAPGPAELLARANQALGRAADLLDRQPEGRVALIPWQGWALRLDDFLITRMMEIAVHSDDLACSVDVEAPLLPAEVLEPVLALLTRLAITRYGQSAVLSALTRSERAPATIAVF